MRRLLIAAAALALVGAASGIIAGESRQITAATTDKVSSDTVSSDTVRQGLEKMGYRVLRIEAEDGRYEARVVDDNAVPVEATYDATTGDLVKAKLD